MIDQPDQLPQPPPECDAEVYLTRYLQGYPLWLCRAEAAEAADYEASLLLDCF